MEDGVSERTYIATSENSLLSKIKSRGSGLGSNMPIEIEGPDGGEGPALGRGYKGRAMAGHRFIALVG